MRPIKEKKERYLGTKLFLKGDRCNSPKCVMVRRPYRPGQHGQKRKRAASEFGTQLQEKQKIQIYFGLNNKQMRQLFRDFSKDQIIKKLQHRLVSVVYALGFAGAPRVARQMISHGHIMVNGKKVTIPSYSVRIGDTVSIRPESRRLKLFEDINEKLKQYEPSPWLTLNKQELKGECVSEISPENSIFPFDVNLVGQFYSR